MKPYYQDDLVTLYHGDSRAVLAPLPDASVDAIVTDPPYELRFMGKGWDSTGIAYDVGLWAECLRVLKPGGHVIAFGASRTWHRLTVAIEDSGFEIRDSIAWLYGSGFPKSLDVAAAVDKLDAATERRERALEFTAWMREHLTAQQINDITGTVMGSHYVTDKEQPSVATAEIFDQLREHLPAVPDRIEVLVADRTVESRNWAARKVTGQHENPAAAQTWRANLLGGEAAPARERRDIAHTAAAAEWQGWGTALKPAFEPTVVGRKPFAGTVAANVVTFGTGALNIDACRIEAHDGQLAEKYASVQGAGAGAVSRSIYGNDSRDREGAAPHLGGRWPTNVVTDEVGAAFIEQQQKGASKYFPVFRYEAKAPTSERPNVDGMQHATVKPLDLMRWLVRLVTPPGGVVLEPFAGSGTTIEAALLEGFSCIAVELEADHLPLIMQRITKPLQQSLFGDWEDAA